MLMAVFVLSPDLEPLLAEARDAFSADTSYAIDIALSASDIINRKESANVTRDAS